ncbi:hypothetical protein [Longitalea arenae]|uniref:hypothetical protein n=1 Tax=Longitalea arenae TaxID=2812558 RepID=UPI0019684522|nr:hypothetical protein [Longitalea arenae]
MMDARVHRRMEALIEFCEKNGMGLLLTDGKYSLGKLKHYPFNSDFEKELRDRLNERNGRTMFFWEYKELMEKYNATKTEFLAIVLKNNWTYYPFKFKLSPKSTYVVFKTKIVDKL